MNGIRVEATRFTVTPDVDVVDIHNVQVHVEQRRNGRWTAGDRGEGGLWFDRAGVAQPACGANADLCSHDFATAMRLAVEAAQQIAEKLR